jgi:branched-chain amino acid aminotransferase
LTGTAAEVTPVREIDGKQVGPGKPGQITKQLQQKYYEVIHGEDSRYEKWLDFV